MIRTFRKALILLGLAAFTAAASTPLLRLERSLSAMGTTFTIAAYGPDRFVMESAIDEAFEETGRLEQLLSNYRPDSEWSLVNREAAQRPVEVSEELFNLLQKCLQYSRESEGTFDITVGPLMKLWGFYKGQARIPRRVEIRTVQSRIGYQNIQIDPVRRTVRFLRPVEMDPGGIGKGYAVDRMAEILVRRGFDSAIISAGRSSIYGIGAPPNEPRGWRITIPHPRDPRRHVAEYYLKNHSMSTSGSTEKFFAVGRRTFSHIMDPRSGRPAEGMLQVSVLAPRTIDSEAWTKPYFVLGRQWAARHKSPQFTVFLCEDRSEIACVSLP